MKKTAVSAVCIFMLLFLCGFSGLSGFMGGKSNDGKNEGTVDLKALEVKEVRIVGLVSLATQNFLKSYALVYEAAGKKEEAEKLLAVANELSSSPRNLDKNREAVRKVNNATAEIEKINLEKDINEDLAKKNLGESILNLGLGLVFDGLAVPDSVALVKETQNAITLVKAKPMAYGPTALAKLTNTLSVANFVSVDVAAQVTAVSGISQKLYDYAKLKGIPVPTQEEINKKAKELQKE